MSRKTILIGILLLFVPLLLVSQQPVERVDLNVMHKIKTAELGGGGGGRGGAGRGAPIMETMYNLTDRYGPRLTNSPQYRAAGDWAVGQLKEWGLSNVHLEKWSTKSEGRGGGGGRGNAGPSSIPSWQITGYSGAMVEPTYMSIIGYPQAWSGGTDGPVTGEAIRLQLQTPADLDTWHGKLKGKIVLMGAGPLDLRSAWSGGTDGPVTGEAIRLQLQTPADLDTWHGKLKGKIVLMGAGPLDL